MRDDIGWSKRDSERDSEEGRGKITSIDTRYKKEKREIAPSGKHEALLEFRKFNRKENISLI